MMASVPKDVQPTRQSKKAPRPGATRLRFGVVMLLIWWIPFWMLAPYIAKQFTSSNSDRLVAEITTLIVVIQTIIGLCGAFLAGSEVKQLIKTTPKRQLLATVWRVLLHGNI